MWKTWGWGLSVVLAVSLFGLPMRAEAQSLEQVVQEMKKEMEDLRARVHDLEQRNQELASRVQAEEIRGASLSAEVAALPVSPPPGNSSLKEEVIALKTKFPAELYGQIRLDAAYDDSEVNEGNYARWVESEDILDDDDQLNLTARQSRFGIDFKGPSDDWLKTSAKIEIDFFEGGGENKNRIQMRHAYLKLDWPQCDFSLLAGQTWDVVAPLNPSTLNYSVQWWAGNIGYRIPQLRLTKGFTMPAGTRMEVQVAAVRDLGHTAFTSDIVDSGEDSGLPGVEGRVGISVPTWCKDKKAQFGISGLWERLELPIEDHTDHCKHTSWVAALDLSLPLTERLGFQAEAFRGQDLDTVLGGVGQGINMDTMEEIRGKGGWMQLSYGPVRKTTFNMGVGVDDPEDQDLPAGGRTKNTAYWGNVQYDLNEAVSMGLELSHWKTEYLDQPDGDALRLQTSFIYKF
ncbi:MAG: hypothetical protein HUU16_05055 [Candidatus Omnitrophica bacterium]|nr:hypothetical protein [Candidatus Omnitrophota bacterium]